MSHNHAPMYVRDLLAKNLDHWHYSLFESYPDGSVEHIEHEDKPKHLNRCVKGWSFRDGYLYIYLYGKKPTR